MLMVSLGLFFPNDAPNFLKVHDLYLVTQTWHFSCDYLTKRSKIYNFSLLHVVSSHVYCSIFHLLLGQRSACVNAEMKKIIFLR